MIKINVQRTNALKTKISDYRSFWMRAVRV